jgi:hypothetical protein
MEFCSCCYEMGVVVYARSYISMLDILFVYMNIMPTIQNEITNTYRVKNFCYDDISSKSYLCRDMRLAV